MNHIKNYDIESNSAEFDTPDGTVRREVEVSTYNRCWPFLDRELAVARPKLHDNEALVETICGKQVIIKLYED